MSDKGDINEVRLFGGALSHEQIKKNCYDGVISAYSIDSLVGGECNLYDLMREDGAKLTVTSSTTKEEIQEFRSGEETFLFKFYNQVNQDEEPIKIYGMPYSEE